MNNSYNSDIGALLKEKRIKSNLSLRAVASRMNVHHSTVAKWESGINTISAEDMLKYLNVLNIDPNDFIKELTS